MPQNIHPIIITVLNFFSVSVDSNIIQAELNTCVIVYNEIFYSLQLRVPAGLAEISRNNSLIAE